MLRVGCVVGVGFGDILSTLGWVYGCFCSWLRFCCVVTCFACVACDWWVCGWVLLIVLWWVILCLLHVLFVFY